MSQLGPTIASLRYDRRMSLQKVADAAGLTKAHVWELEKGRSNNPSLTTIIGLGTALGVPPIDLFKAALNEG